VVVEETLDSFAVCAKARPVVDWLQRQSGFPLTDEGANRLP
jgi:hypothetical protein